MKTYHFPILKLFWFFNHFIFTIQREKQSEKENQLNVVSTKMLMFQTVTIWDANSFHGDRMMKCIKYHVLCFFRGSQQTSRTEKTQQGNSLIRNNSFGTSLKISVQSPCSNKNTRVLNETKTSSPVRC